MTMHVAVIGAGSWGTTLADMLARGGHEVVLWARETEVVESIRREHVNHLFLPGCQLAPTLQVQGDIGDAVPGAQLILMVTPSHATRSATSDVARAVKDARPVAVSASKGLEPNTLHVLTDVLEEALPDCPVAALSGPSFAQEVYQRQPTAVVAASADPKAAETVQQVFSNSYFRVYTSRDVLGVQLGGALKNVVAIACGILEGMGLGYNPRAALITRGLAEMARLGEALGADPLTFAGLAGMGDLVLTATGALSRNRSLGVELGKGRTLAEILAERRTVAEGVTTAQVSVDLARRTGVELPIAAEVARVLFEGKAPRQAIRDLMERELKAEQWR
ncbi:MAG: NAD(P)-dependent glycerol-3-phosphate dehydrogenase [Gemmatimonadetes bacterium]|nr:NAD(P)-dependent glycerol-3-phosphate dehydrogenase [Gemmatimonadota bacterium]